MLLQRRPAGGLSDHAGWPGGRGGRRYLAVHPSAETFAESRDFFPPIIPSAAYLVAGFGRIVDLTSKQFLTDLAGAKGLLEAEADAVEHMNEDHRDVMDLYATRLLGAESVDLALHWL